MVNGVTNTYLVVCIVYWVGTIDCVGVVDGFDFVLACWEGASFGQPGNIYKCKFIDTV